MPEPAAYEYLTRKEADMAFKRRAWTIFEWLGQTDGQTILDCGCGRGFAGAASHRATTTATVVESALTRVDVVLAFQTSLVDGGWPIEWAEEVADDNLAVADDLSVGTVIGRRLDGLLVRAISKAP